MKRVIAYGALLGIVLAMSMLVWSIPDTTDSPCNCGNICPTSSHCGMTHCAMEHNRNIEAYRLALQPMARAIEQRYTKEITDYENRR